MRQAEMDLLISRVFLNKMGLKPAGYIRSFKDLLIIIRAGSSNPGASAGDKIFYQVKSLRELLPWAP